MHAFVWSIALFTHGCLVAVCQRLANPLLRALQLQERKQAKVLLAGQKPVCVPLPYAGKKGGKFKEKKQKPSGKVHKRDSKVLL